MSLTLEGCMVNSVSSQTRYKSKIYAVMEVKGTSLQMQLDSGATCNVMPLQYVPEGINVNSPESTVSLKMYSQGEMTVQGTCKIPVRNPKNRKKYLVHFVVVDAKNCVPLLGSRAIQQMELITVRFENISLPETEINQVEESTKQCMTKEEVYSEFRDLFKGIGQIPGIIHLTTDPSVPPVVAPPHRVPVAMKPKLKKELARLEGLNIIEKVVEPTDWVSNLVIMTKTNGKTRICIDPKPLNEALKREHYPLPVIEDVLPQLCDVKVYSKADLKEGFLQCTLDEESSQLTAFQTPWGRYRYKRMPFGIKPAPELFQKLDQNL
ncbi:hypothetical protein HOLleu_43885 [Holothuria leucospilota]|uniref:Reverse transcriptase domain-containing protein n=1 Tax=Holothuria leucospilota TaxID=206669 RepID=A0A9Q1B8V3_HOLLE|nr:hypothetical protein HOLleu_43885 [Holothuria leucospilota]